MEEKLRDSGIGTAIKNQRRSLELNNVSHTDDLDDDFDILHLNIIGLKSLYLAKKMRSKGKKIVLHAHVTADDFRNSYRFSNTLAPLLRRYLTYYYNQADVVLCPSEYTRGVLKRYGIKKPIIPISNGIDTNKFRFSEEKRQTFREKYGINGITPLCVGHMFIRKGMRSFLKVARKFDNRFIWLGRRFRGLEEPEVSTLIKNAPANVAFIEFVEDIVATYCGTDVFFFPSLCENQGIVLLEAAACRRPIVARNLPAYEGWLKDGINCLKAENNRELADKLKMVMEDRELAEKLGNNAYEMSQKHSLDNIGKKLKKIYSDLLDGEIRG